MNWKEKLKRHWLNLLIVLLWLASGILWSIKASTFIEYGSAAAAYACAICWGAIFYKEMKKDSE